MLAAATRAGGLGLGITLWPRGPLSMPSESDVFSFSCMGISFRDSLMIVVLGICAQRIRYEQGCGNLFRRENHGWIVQGQHTDDGLARQRLASTLEEEEDYVDCLSWMFSRKGGARRGGEHP